MKKLYRKGTVHPSPPTKTDQLSFLPAAILTLAAALSPEDREVLAYLLSADPHRHKPADHLPPLFNCTCFSCYTTFWLRWDSSPNRHLIHDIIDALEDPQPPKKHKKDRKKRPANKARTDSGPGPNRADSKPESPGESGLVGQSASGGDCQEGSEKGSVRKMVSFIGEKIWGVWG